MFGDALGVMIVLALGGLVLPILLILAAVLADLLALLWYAGREWHDRLWPMVVRSLAAAMHRPAALVGPRA